MNRNNLDMSSDPQNAGRADGGRSPKPFLGVHFTCCRVYGRIYINRTGDGYAGHCPRCAKSLRFRIGVGGVNQRFFSAY